MRPRLILLCALAGCTPEPASTQEILQTVRELVDQGRALAVENAVAALVADVDFTADPEDLRDAVAAALVADVACATVTPGEDPGALAVEFADACAADGRTYTGGFDVTYARTAGGLLVTLHFDELTSAGTTLTGTTRISAGVDDTRRVVSELRLDVAAPDAEAAGRQVEIQSDRIQRRHDGALQVDGFHRWQTLMGRWKAELAGWTLDPAGLLPGSGLTEVDTPFEHDIVVDHADAGDGAIEVRANGGRRDRVFRIAADGAITELGED